MNDYIVVFRDKNSREVIGPVWTFEEATEKPVRWAESRCYENCEYAIVDGKDGYYHEGVLMGVKDSVLAHQEWLPKPLVIYCETAGCQNVSVNVCDDCGGVICIQHSRPAISDRGEDVFICPWCHAEMEEARDFNQIRREWRDYRLEGDETPDMRSWEERIP